MNRKLSTALLLLLALLVGGIVLSGVEAADAPRKAPEEPVPPPPKMTTLSPRPKVLSRSVLAGVGFLVKQQRADGGWAGEQFGFGVGGFGVGGVGAFGARGGQLGQFGNLGGPGKPGRQPPKGMNTPPSEVANTSIATLALLRAGYSPRQGSYAGNLRKAIAFICNSVEKADKESLSVTDVQGTQVQRKIGPSVDTFLAGLVLAEARGRMPDVKSERRVYNALKKVVGKLETNQKGDGTWGQGAWAPVLGQALASRALNRAQQVGIAVDPEKLARAAEHARTNLQQAAKGGRVELAGAAGVALYATASGIGGLQDAANTGRQLAEGAKGILTSPTATDDEKARAREQIKKVDETDKAFLEAIRAVAKQSTDPKFVRGFGTDGGEEFLSFMLVGEALRAKLPKEWTAWDRAITTRLTRSQNRDGSWAGSHCITGKTFCTATAIMAMMADRAPVPAVKK